MSNRNRYNELWQQKRNELPISTNMHTDWSEMHNLLDRQMPVSGNSGSGAQGTGARPAYLAHLAKLKLLFAVAGLIIAGTVTYFALSHKAGQSTGHNKTKLSKDSVLANEISKSDSATAIYTDEGKNAIAKSTADNSTGKSSENADNNPKETEKAFAGEKHSASGTSAAGYHAKDANGNSIKSSLAGNRRLINTAHNRGLPSSSINRRTHFNGSARRGSSGNSLLNGRVPDVLAQNQQTGNTRLISEISPVTQHYLTWEEVVKVDFKEPGVPEHNFDKPARPLSSKQKVKAKRDAYNSNLDWGLLIGANAKGSFTAKAQNHNIYGSSPVDIYVGLFGTYNFSGHWALGLQGKFLVPHTISGKYSHTHQVLIDTPQNLTTPETLQISDSRKVYTVDIPLHAIYKVSPGFSIKAGPTLSIPVKETDGSGTFTTKKLLDSPAYYHGVTNSLKATRAEKKIRYGASVGVGFNLNPVSFEATYNYNFQQQKVSSALGGYSANINSLQLTIGIKLNKQKK